MKPVLQTKFGTPDGNCFSACVASILELPIEAVPEFQCDYADAVWWERWIVWWWDHGYEVDWGRIEKRPIPPGYVILGVKVPDPHAVVALDGAVVWNPHHNVPLPEVTVYTDWTALKRRAS